MTIFLNILSVLFFILTIATLIKPKRILFFFKNPKRFHALIFFLIFSFVVGEEDRIENRKMELETKKKIEAEKEKNQKYFNKNNESIIIQIRTLTDNKEYQKASNLLKKWDQYDKQNILGDLEKEIGSILKRSKIRQIEAELKTIPESDYQLNLSKYRELSKLDPKNSDYKFKISYYKSKIEREKKVEKQFSAWDGSHRVLKRSIKKLMHDPGSFEHVKTVYWDRGDYILVQMSYRGKNAFGALVLNSTKAKFDIDGNLISIVETSP